MPPSLWPRLPQLPSDLDRMGHAVERVEGVDQEDAVARARRRVLFERFHLAREGHHPAVRVRALHRDSEHPAGENVGGGAAAADVGGPARGEGAVDALGAAQAELHHRIALGRDTDAGRLGRDQGLEVDDVEQRRLDELGGDDRSAHAHQGRRGKHDPSLVHRVDVALELEVAQVVEEALVEEKAPVRSGEGSQVVEVFLHEVEVLQELLGPGQAAGHGEAAAEGVVAEVEMEDRLLAVRARLPVRVGHGQLIQVGQ